MRSIALPLLLLPDRLPSLIVLVGFWIPPALAGWVAAEFLQRGANRRENESLRQGGGQLSAW